MKILQPGGSEYYLDLCNKENKCDGGALCEKAKSSSEWVNIGSGQLITVEKNLEHMSSAIKFEIKIKTLSLSVYCNMFRPSSVRGLAATQKWSD